MLRPTICRSIRLSPELPILGRYVLLLAAPGCVVTLPSQRLQSEVNLPQPAVVDILPIDERLAVVTSGETLEISPAAVIRIAFDNQPDIKSSYERYKSEEARYDFFYASRDSLTPTLRVRNEFSEDRADETVVRDRAHTTELGLEKRFFDTTELNVGVGFQSAATDQAIGDHPFVSADLRYPLWVSRRKLERTSEEIFRRNELDDAQLAYIQTVRGRLEDALSQFNEVVFQQAQLDIAADWRRDLEQLSALINELASDVRDMTADAQRVAAELSRVRADERNIRGWLEIQLANLKADCGLPFNVNLELRREPFNPFEAMSHAELLAMSLETDPEILTRRNAMRNAQVQLDLARRGRWDFTLELDAESGLEGRGEDESVSDWGVSVGFEVSRVDDRVTTSLINQAQANIARFQQAISARENAIFTGTLEPFVRLDTLTASRDELAGAVPLYEDDYRKGLTAYRTESLNIDDLLKRRETLRNQQLEVARLTFILSVNVAELCAATGKFFEILEATGSG